MAPLFSYKNGGRPGDVDKSYTVLALIIFKVKLHPMQRLKFDVGSAERGTEVGGLWTSESFWHSS